MIELANYCLQYRVEIYSILFFVTVIISTLLIFGDKYE